LSFPQKSKPSNSSPQQLTPPHAAAKQASVDLL